MQVQANGSAALQRIDNRFYALEASVKALEARLMQQSQTLSSAMGEDFQDVVTILKASKSLPCNFEGMASLAKSYCWACYKSSSLPHCQH